MMKSASKVKNIGLCSTLALCLAACGGGSTPLPVSPVVPTVPSGPATPPTTPPPSSDPDTFRTAEYENNYGLEAIHAADAYAAGYTGEGVVIGVVDFNFDFDSTDVRYSGLSRDGQQVYKDLYEEQFGESEEIDPHGQAVAVVAAGVKDDVDTHGVAYNATVIGVDFFSGVNITDQRSDGILFHVSDPWQYLSDRGAKVVNTSFGFDEGGATSEDGNNPDEWYVLDYDVTAVQLGMLLVASAGNNYDPARGFGINPSLSTLETLDFMDQLGILTEGDGAFMIVGAVDQNNQIADFSNRAGDLTVGGVPVKNFYLVAPGVDIVAPYNTVEEGPGLYLLSGTSFSAPHVTGAAALIFERWPNLTAREVADILFETATDLGAAGVDNIFGRGLLNVAAALEPVGTASVATGQGVVPVTSMGLNLGPAFGDAIGLSTALSNTMMLDDYNRDFRIDISGLMNTANPGVNLLNRMDSRRNWQASNLALGTTTQMGYVISVDQYSTPAFALTGQAAEDFTPEINATFELTGAYKSNRWAIGTGRSLTDALSRQPVNYRVDGRFSITGANDTPLPVGRGAYMVTGRDVGKNTEIWFGAAVGEHDGNKDHQLEALQRDSRTLSVAAHLDHYRSWGRVGAELGILEEDDAILGSRAAGGLALTGSAATVWMTLDADADIGHGITISARITGTATDPSAATGSLFGNSGVLLGSSFQAMISKSDQFQNGDMISFSVYQPLRMEKANLHLYAGDAVDPETGDILFRDDRVSLAPSGRELALEAAYSLAVNGWKLEANMGYRFDAGHRAGMQDALMMLGITRPF